ncbi:MAG: cobyrinate a,c-diamide synthase [Thermodesulfobacteriota bacterium]
MDKFSRRIPGLLLAGPHSGCGKTTVTLGLMAAFAQRGMKVQPFKAGPDFIDPTLHCLVTGRISHNLDPWMCGEVFVRGCFSRHGASADVSVVEGVMGLFDGGEGSAAHLAKVLGLPVILVVDARSMAESAAAVVMGFETLDPAVRLAGVILNRVGSERHLGMIENAIAAHCRAEVVGFLPREASFAIPERHLGLHMGDEAPISNEALGHLAEVVARHIDLDRLLALAATAEPHPVPASRNEQTGPRVRIGIARDQAFCFYYEENLALLAAAGAELVAFSPLADAALPDDLSGLYLGGGYPELYAEELAANQGLRRVVRAWSAAGRPLYAECGGFMYLSEGIVDGDGQYHPMAGVFPVAARMRQGRAALGYREATLAGDTLFGPAGTVLRGHEFHYSDIDPMPAAVGRCYRLADGREEGYLINGRTLGSYLHLHFGGTPEAAAHFVRLCREQ